MNIRFVTFEFLITIHLTKLFGVQMLFVLHDYCSNKATSISKIIRFCKVTLHYIYGHSRSPADLDPVGSRIFMVSPYL